MTNEEMVFAIGKMFGAAEERWDKRFSDLEANMNRRFDAVEADLAVVKQDVAVLKEDVAVLKEDVAVLQENVAILQENVTELNVRVGSLEGTMTRVLHEVEQVAVVAQQDRRRVERLEVVVFSEAGGMLQGV